MRTARSPGGTAYLFVNNAWRIAKHGEAVINDSPWHPSQARIAFGPDWTRVSIPNTQIVEYRKELKVPVINQGIGLATYTVPMDRDRLEIGEFDDNRGFYVSWQRDGRVDVRRNADGTPAWHAVRFPNARYLDLNGDGILDLLMDYREDAGGQLFILFDNRFTPVKTPTEGVSETLSTAETADGVNYVFSGDKWQAK